MNRIDSRARGNAPQLLEKYKKLAHDAMLNGDRVQEEYYLQFADHYFRVIADQKQRQEEQRQPRRDERSQDYDDDGADQDYPPRERSREPQRRNDAPAETRASTDEGEGEGEERSRSVYEPAENPFLRDSRSSRAAPPKPRKARRTDGDRQDDGRQGDDRQDNVGKSAPVSGGFDPSALPPSIATSGDDVEGQDSSADDKPAKRTRAKAKAPAAAKPKATRTRKSADKAEAGEETPAAAQDEDGEAKPRRRRTPRKPASGEDASANTADADA